MLLYNVHVCMTISFKRSKSLLFFPFIFNLNRFFFFCSSCLVLSCSCCSFFIVIEKIIGYIPHYHHTNTHKLQHYVNRTKKKENSFFVCMLGCMCALLYYYHSWHRIQKQSNLHLCYTSIFMCKTVISLSRHSGVFPWRGFQHFTLMLCVRMRGAWNYWLDYNLTSKTNSF